MFLRNVKMEDTNDKEAFFIYVGVLDVPQKREDHNVSQPRRIQSPLSTSLHNLQNYGANAHY
jgi:hypothetical protein